MAKNKTPNKRSGKSLADISFSLTKWIGSPASLILHTVFFIFVFMLPYLGFDFDRVLLSLTTLVSLEAIYLAILIQLSVNKNTEDLLAVGEEISEIQDDVEEIQEDVDEIQEDVDEIQRDVDKVESHVGEIQTDVDEIQGDIDVIEHKDTEGGKRELEQTELLLKISTSLESLMVDLERLKSSQASSKISAKENSKIL